MDRTKEFEAAFEKAYEKYSQEMHRQQSELTRLGMRRKAEAGGTNGKAPLGYVNVRRGKKAWVEIDPVMGPLVREAFDLAATGKHPIRRLCLTMAEKGLTNRRGKPLSPSTLYGMLTNRYYAGDTTRDGRSIRAAHAFLVPQSLFGVVQDRLIKRRRCS